MAGTNGDLITARRVSLTPDACRLPGIDPVVPPRLELPVDRSRGGAGWGADDGLERSTLISWPRMSLCGGSGHWYLQRWDGGNVSNFLSSRTFPKSVAASRAQPQWMVSP